MPGGGAGTWQAPAQSLELSLQLAPLLGTVPTCGPVPHSLHPAGPAGLRYYTACLGDGGGGRVCAGDSGSNMSQLMCALAAGCLHTRQAARQGCSRAPTCPRHEGSALSTGVRCSLMPPASGGQQESKSEWGGGPLTVPRGDTSSLCSPSAGTGVLTDAHVWNACREPASCLQARQTAGLPPPRAGLNNLPSISEMTGLEMRDTRPFWVAPSLLPP